MRGEEARSPPQEGELVATSPSDEEVEDFIRDTFGSVWTLELLLHLKGQASRSWTPAELVAALRASELVIDRGLQSLLAAGLIVIDEAGSAHYSPASAGLSALIDEAEVRYAQKPDAVRRLIIVPRKDGLSAFADAFRLRKD
jgi:hypothetical protein